MPTATDNLGPTTRPARTAFRVVDDLAACLPISDAELDVVEAFLGAQLRALLNNEGEEGTDSGLNPCPDHARLPHPTRSCPHRR